MDSTTKGGENEHELQNQIHYIPHGIWNDRYLPTCGASTTIEDKNNQRHYSAGEKDALKDDKSKWNQRQWFELFRIQNWHQLDDDVANCKVIKTANRISSAYESIKIAREEVTEVPEDDAFANALFLFAYSIVRLVNISVKINAYMKILGEISYVASGWISLVNQESKTNIIEAVKSYSKALDGNRYKTGLVEVFNEILKMLDTDPHESTNRQIRFDQLINDAVVKAKYAMTRRLVPDAQAGERRFALFVSQPDGSSGKKTETFLNTQAEASDSAHKRKFVSEAHAGQIPRSFKSSSSTVKFKGILLILKEMMGQLKNEPWHSGFSIPEYVETSKSAEEEEEEEEEVRISDVSAESQKIRDDTELLLWHVPGKSMQTWIGLEKMMKDEMEAGGKQGHLDGESQELLLYLIACVRQMKKGLATKMEKLSEQIDFLREVYQGSEVSRKLTIFFDKQEQILMELKTDFAFCRDHLAPEISQVFKLLIEELGMPRK